MTRPVDRPEGSDARIIEVAARLLADVGPEVSVDLICGAAHCSKGAFYHHFSSKRQLVRRALGEICSEAPLTTEVLLRFLPLARRDPEVANLIAAQVAGSGAAGGSVALARRIGGRVARALRPRAA